MFEREMDELRVKLWVERYDELDKELLARMKNRRESELLYSFGLVLSGFGGSAGARKYLRYKVGENA
jgi:hypothetical protein